MRAADVSELNHLVSQAPGCSFKTPDLPVSLTGRTQIDYTGTMSEVRASMTLLSSSSETLAHLVGVAARQPAGRSVDGALAAYGCLWLQAEPNFIRSVEHDLLLIGYKTPLVFSASVVFVPSLSGQKAVH